MELLTTIAISAVLVMATVLVHHEALRLLSDAVLPHTERAPRWRGCVIVLVAITAHIVEIELYAVAFHFSATTLELGGVIGEEASLATYSYFSFACFTSLGIGDIVPEGHLRLIAGVEALNGLVLIGWSASFLLVELRARRPGRQETIDANRTGAGAPRKRRGTFDR